MRRVPACLGGLRTQQLTESSFYQVVRYKNLCYHLSYETKEIIPLVLYFHFVSPIFILATVFISDLGISAETSLCVCIIIFSEGVCYLYISTRN